MLEYPAPLLSLTSKHGMLKMQRVQNRCLRDIAKTSNEDRELTLSELHEKYGIQALNVRLYNRTQNCWRRLQDLNPDLCQRSLDLNDDPVARHRGEHAWWPRLAKFVTRNEPEPLYTDYVPRQRDDNEDDNADVDPEDEEE